MLGDLIASVSVVGACAAIGWGLCRYSEGACQRLSAGGRKQSPVRGIEQRIT